VEEVELFPSRGFAFVTMSSISGAQAAAASVPQPGLFRSIKTASPAPPLKVDFTRLPRVLPSYMYVRVRVRVGVCLVCECVFVCVMYRAGNPSPTLYVCC
jgi:hypothetical protein